MRFVRLVPAPALTGFGVLTAAGVGAAPLVTATPVAAAGAAAPPSVTTDLAAACGAWAGALRRADRYGALGFTAAALALGDAGVEPPSATDPAWGVAVGSAVGCWGSNARHHRSLRPAGGGDPSPALFVRTVSNAVNGDISIAWHLGGPSDTFVSGWTAGAEALIAAGAAIADGRARRMLACGVEAPEGPFRTEHAAARRRSGSDWLPEVLAEGAAAVLMDGGDGRQTGGGHEAGGGREVGGRPDAPRLLAYAHGRDRSGSWSLAGLSDAAGLPRARSVVLANALPPETRARLAAEADGLDVFDLPARAGEIGAAGAVAAVAVAAAVLGGDAAARAAERRPSSALVLARGIGGELVILAIAG